MTVDKLPTIFGGNMLEESIALRKSVRKYSGDDLTKDQVSHLLWAAYGVGEPRRTVPSAGSIYPLTIYLLQQGILYQYEPKGHVLKKGRIMMEMQERLCQACLSQKSVGQAPVVIIVAANYDKIKRKYRGRGERYAILEAGHVGQNIHLQCVALGLGCVMIGAFSDRKVKDSLGIDEDPLYVIPVGKP
jgi:SagB-type dehydrogenase family enzyme